MKRLNRRAVEALQSTIENGQMNADYASRIALAIWQEWNARKGVTPDEIDSMIKSLTEAKIQIEMALEELEACRS